MEYYKGLPLVARDDVLIAGTDGNSIFYNPEYRAKAGEQEWAFILEHAYLHALFSKERKEND